MGRIIRCSYALARKLIPPSAAYFKGRSMRLRRGEAVSWHTTGTREEVLIVLRGAAAVEYDRAPHRRARARVRAGECAFIPRHTRHRVRNPFPTPLRYLYFTAGSTRC